MRRLPTAPPAPAEEAIELELEAALLEAPTARAALDYARTATAALRLEAGEDLAELARVRARTASLASRSYARTVKPRELEEVPF